jgi:hypothetical protein
METASVAAREYMTCAESAKMLRKALAARFPGVKFSVRSKTYSGGASINVSWTGGPCGREVERITCRYEGADFDGMIDLKTSKDALLSLPDGSLKRVRFGSDYIFCQREDGFEFAKVASAIAAETLAKADWQENWQWQQDCDRIGSKVAHNTDILPGETHDTAARRGVSAYWAGTLEP